MGEIERLEDKIYGAEIIIVDKIESLKGDVRKSDRHNHNTRLALISILIVGFLALTMLFMAVITYGRD